MKIHGTAKGGALSTKDFGVAFGGAAALPAIDDDGLIALYNFDESSLSVPNSSQSSDSGGSDFDATAVGATTNVSGHFGDCFSFDGVDDKIALYDDSATAKSIWNWMHNGSSWSFTYWMRRISTDDYARIADQLYDGGGTLANGFTSYIFGLGGGNGNWMITNNSAQRVLDAAGFTGFWNDLDWHFYVHTMNFAPATNNLVSTMDNSTTVYMSKSAISPDTNDALADMTGMSSAGGGNENNAEIQQFTFWDVVIDQDIQDALWNDGAGRSFY